jgi:CMP-N,N'-diacetyllegionaminic acid synthase
MNGVGKVLALISARGGSKGLPGKNIRDLAGKPLIVYSIEVALESANVDRVVVSTDSVEIADIAREAGADVPFLRPAELARDDTPSLPVSQHAVKWLAENEGWECDVVIELQPVAPIRLKEDIDGALQMLVDTGADTVVSLCRVDGAFHPYWMKTMRDGRLAPLMELYREYVRRQDLPPVYRRNGSILAVRKNVLMEQNTYYGEDMRGYLMPDERSIDIDTEVDFRIAELFMGRAANEIKDREGA